MFASISRYPHYDVQGKEVDAVMVIRRVKQSDGAYSTHFTFAGEPEAGPSLLVNAMGKYMGWK